MRDYVLVAKPLFKETIIERYKSIHMFALREYNGKPGRSYVSSVASGVFAVSEKKAAAFAKTLRLDQDSLFAKMPQREWTVRQIAKLAAGAK